MNKDIEQRIAWINERVPLDGLRISYIKLQMQEHTKLLIDEIADLKSQLLISEQKVKLNYNCAIESSKSEANEALQKSHDELLKIAKHYIKNHDYWVIANADKLTRNNK